VKIEKCHNNDTRIFRGPGAVGDKGGVGMAAGGRGSRGYGQREPFDSTDRRGPAGVSAILGTWDIETRFRCMGVYCMSMCLGKRYGTIVAKHDQKEFDV